MITTNPMARRWSRLIIFTVALVALVFGALSFQPTRQAHAATLAPMQHMQHMQQLQAHASTGGPKAPNEAYDQCLLIQQIQLEYEYYNWSIDRYIWAINYNIKNNCPEGAQVEFYTDLVFYCNGNRYTGFDSWGKWVWNGHNWSGYGSAGRQETTACTDAWGNPQPVKVYAYVWAQGLYTNYTSNGWNANLYL
jgi:hypothetical protein